MKHVAVVTALVATVGVAPPATADVGPTTFRGTCSLVGTVDFDPGLSTKPLPTTATARATGRCSGVLTLPDGTTRRLTDEPAGYRGVAAGSQSCAAGTTTGRSRLDLAGTSVRFTFSETRLGVLALLRLRDRAGATTTGIATVRPAEDSLSQVLACAGPDGLRRVPVAISTTSPRS